MADDKLAQTRNTGPDPVQAVPNADRGKTYDPPNPPGRVTEETQKLPEKTAEEKVSREMPEAVDAVKRRT